MIKNFFSGQINSITIAAVLIAASSLLSRLLGVFRDRILAGEFGAGDTLDIYYAAFRVPDLIFNLLILGALSAGFIPIFTRLIKNAPPQSSPYQREEENSPSLLPARASQRPACFQLSKAMSGRQEGPLLKMAGGEAWELASNILNILGAGLVVLCGLGVIFAPALMKIITPGFSGEKMDLTIALARIMFLSPIFLGLSGVFGGILQSCKRFFIYSLAPIFYNVGIIIGALYFVPLWGVYGLAWGVVLGAFMHMAVQMPAVWQIGFRYSFIFNFKEKSVREIWRMMIPRTMSLAVAQINLVVLTIIASTLAAGSLAVFNFANNLQIFPVGIIGISFAIAAFPALASAAFEREKLIYNFSSVARQILFFIVPATVLILTLRAQIIRVVLGTGQFDWNDTVLTLDTLGFFALSLFAQSLIPLLVRVFYARHDSRTPFFIGLATAAANVVLSLWLGKKMGVAGLALAFSIANIANFIVLWLVLRFKIEGLDEARILKSAFKFSLAAITAGGAIQLLKEAIVYFADMTKLWGVFAQGALAGTAGILVYVVICYILKSEELFNFAAAVRRRLRGAKVEAEDRGEARGI